MKKIILILGFLIFALLGYPQEEGENLNIDNAKLNNLIYGIKSGGIDTIIGIHPDSIGQFYLKNITDPILPLDGVNKRYVDGLLFVEPRDTVLYNNALAENPVHEEAKTFYDPVKHAQSYHNEIADVTVNMGQENVVRAYNNSVSTITNLTPVYLVGDTFKIGSNLTFIESRFIGVATHDIPAGTWGYATNLGEVGGDLSGFTDNADLYLGDDVLIETAPTGGEFSAYIGKKKNDTTLYVMPSISTYTAEMLKPTGWPDADGNSFPDNVGLQLRASDRTIKLFATPAAVYYHYQDGLKYISAVDSFQWSAVEGIHLIYFDGGVMTEIVNPTSAEARTVLERFPGVSNIYWSIPLDTFIYANNELHTYDMNGQTKGAFNDVHGCTIIDPIPLTDFSVDGSGSLDAHAQYGNNSGTIRNADIKTLVTATPSTTGYSVFFKSGATAWSREINPGFGIVTTGTGRIAFNEEVVGVWQLTEATSNNYVPYLIVVSNTLAQKIGTVPGDAEYASADAAVAGGINYASSFLQGLPVNEIAEIGLVVFQTRDSYTNSVKSRVVSVTDPVTGATVDYIDLAAGIVGGGIGSTGMTTILDDPNGPVSYAGAGGSLFTVSGSETGWEFVARSAIDLSELTNDLTGLNGLSTTDNAIARYDGTEGNLQNSFAVIDDVGNLTISEDINVNGSINSTGADNPIEILATGTAGYSFGFSQGSGDFTYYGGTSSSKFSVTNAGNTTIAGTATISTIANATGDFLTVPTNGGLITQRTAAQVLSDIGAADATLYVPYTGATGNVDLGLFDLYADSLSVVNDATIGGDLDVAGFIEATTAKLTNLTNNFIPYHVDDATGFANSLAFIDGGYFNLGQLGRVSRSDAGQTVMNIRNTGSGSAVINISAPNGGGDPVMSFGISGVTGFNLGIDADDNLMKLSGTTIGAGRDFLLLQKEGGFTMQNNWRDEIGLIIKGIVSQTENLQEWQTSAGSILASVDETGIFTIAPGTLGAEAMTRTQIEALAVSTFTNDADYISSVTTLANNQVVTATGDNTADGNAGFTSDGSSIVLAGEIESDESRVQALGDRTGSLSTSAASGYKATVTLTGNFELFYEDIKDGGEGSIEVLQNGTGGYSFTLSGFGAYTTEVIMGANSEVAQGASEHTTVSFWRSGTTLYYGFIYDN